MTTQNLWNTAKAVLRGKFRAIQSYLKKHKKTSTRQPNFTPKVRKNQKRKNQKTPNSVEGKKS